jgi:hypothetical protein
MGASPNGREKKLAEVIQSYMKDLTMTDQQFPCHLEMHPFLFCNYLLTSHHIGKMA